MLRGYRCAVFAAFGWLILCGAESLSEKAVSAHSAQKADPPPPFSSAPTPVPSASPSPKFTAYPGYNPDPCYHADDKDAADLCAQWRAAIAAEKAADEARRATKVAWVGTALSALAVLGLIITIRQSRTALKRAKQANRISRESAERQTRGYLSIDHTGYVLLEERGKKLTYTFALKNKGASPAYDVRTHIRCFTEPPEYIPYLVTNERLEDCTTGFVGPDAGFGYFDTPIRTVGNEKSRIRAGKVAIFLVISVAYSDTFGRRYRFDWIGRSDWKNRPGGLAALYANEYKMKRRKNRDTLYAS